MKSFVYRGYRVVYINDKKWDVPVTFGPTGTRSRHNYFPNKYVAIDLIDKQWIVFNDCPKYGDK